MFELTWATVSHLVLAAAISSQAAVVDAVEGVAAPAAVAAAPVPDLSGAWSGTWLSSSTGHDGPLKARFHRVDATHYDVHFRGRFCKLIPFCYRVTLCVAGCQNGCVTLTGSKRLPIFGTFTIRASANCNQFTARYSSSEDCGIFRMSRIAR